MIRLTNLTTLMRQHHITIKELVTFMDVTMTRVREVRNGALVSPGVAFDYNDAILRLVAGRPGALAPEGQLAVPARDVMGTYPVFDSNGKPVRVSIPEND